MKCYIEETSNVYSEEDQTLTDYLPLATTILSLCSFGTMIYVLLKTERKIDFFKKLAVDIKEIFEIHTEGEGEDTQIVLDERLDLMTKTFASAIAKSIKFGLLGELGVQGRLKKGLKGAIAQDVIEKKAPIIKLAGDLLGFNTADYISENPDAIMQLMPMFQGLIKGSPTSSKRKGGVFELG